MFAIRVTVMLCITVLVIITGAVIHSNNQDRYIILPQNNSMFIFDRKTSSINYCTADQCKLVMPYGNTQAPGTNPAMSMINTSIPQGFQPFATPGLDNQNMMLSTSMNNPMIATHNNPMMMLAYMQAAQAASVSGQKDDFSSLQTQPSWMNIMAMMQPTTIPNNKAIETQSPLIPVAMKTSGKKERIPQPKTRKAPFVQKENIDSTDEEMVPPTDDSDTETTDRSSNYVNEDVFDDIDDE